MTAGACERRQLPYDALNPEWEKREFEKFQASSGNARQQAPYGSYLFGRLMQSDLHESCLPALPADIAKCNGATVQGMCILQLVDVANIGANFEYRTEFSTAGPARTLKLGLTDGHQLVFGFEFTPLPQLSVNVTRGTKIVVENVPVRHGLLLLGHDNCQLLENSTVRPKRATGIKHHPPKTDGLSAGVYSTALMTSQFNSSQQKLPAIPRRLMKAAPNDNSQLGSVKVLSAPVKKVSQAAAINSALLPVFVDAPSSNEILDSDNTDPMIEHLFYSPNTPRHLVSSDDSNKEKANTSRKRARPSSAGQVATNTSMKMTQDILVLSPQRSSSIAVGASASSISLLNQIDNTNGLATIRPLLNPKQPFQYFDARLPRMSAPIDALTTARFQIRGCIKSVVGFQFSTGRYQLRVSVEDCTASRKADVAEDFVTRLMGVPCSDFLRTMQTKVQIAHIWAAKMQFALMNLEGIMTFDTGIATTTFDSVPLLLIDCRDFQSNDTRELLQRVKNYRYLRKFDT